MKTGIDNMVLDLRPTNHDADELQIRLKAALRAVKYGEMTVEGAAKEVMQALETHQERVLAPVAATIHDLRSEVTFLRSGDRRK